MSSRLALGFDGGGTQTRAALVAGDGRILSSGLSGSSNINIVGFEKAVEHIRDAAVQCWEHAGISRRPVEAAFLGLSGIDASGRSNQVTSFCIDERLVAPGYCMVGKDSEAALAGGLSGRPGLVLIAGTGSFCLGRDKQGMLSRCGGWGWLVDDVGGGTWMGREALRAVLLAADGRAPETKITARLLDEADVAGVEALAGWIYSRQPIAPSLASLSKCVTGAAFEEDAVALEILKTGAAGLAQLAAKVSSHFDSRSGSTELVLVGGLARSGLPYQRMIETALRSSVQNLLIAEPELPPVIGAVLRAFELTGRGLDDVALARMKERMPNF